jgi:hypothetical protein
MHQRQQKAANFKHLHIKQNTSQLTSVKKTSQSASWKFKTFSHSILSTNLTSTCSIKLDFISHKNLCQIRRFQATNGRIKWPIFVHKYNFVQIVSLKTPPKVQ